MTEESNTDDIRGGVPIGGVGAGCLEMGRDGTLRNVTINNNRTAATRIPSADGAFLAIRAVTDAGINTRILQPATSISFEQAGLGVDHAPASEFAWEGIYPASTYRMKDDAFPLMAGWRGLAPIIPYDTEAAILPMAIFAVQIQNTTKGRVEVSALFNWENLRGCTRNEWPEDRGRVGYIVMNEQEQLTAISKRDPETSHLPFVGLSFGMGEPIVQNADGDYSVVACPEVDTRLTYLGWDKTDPGDVRDFWQGFYEDGSLSNKLDDPATAHCGAICQTRYLDPGERTQFVFIFTWSCPRFVVDGRDLSNGYLMKHGNSVSSAAYGIEHHKYFLKAISTLRDRFIDSSLPRWYSRMLLNNSYVFSTNSFLTRDGEFAMMESPADPRVGVLDRSFYSSLGTLLFFPGYAHVELALHGKNTSETGQPAHVLGVETVHAPSYLNGHGGDDDELIPMFILLACRNFKMTGNLARLMNLYPALQRVADEGMTQAARRNPGGADIDNDSKESAHCATPAGLWTAAHEAMAYLARALKHTEDADEYAARAQLLKDRFERWFWNSKARVYQFNGTGGGVAKVGELEWSSRQLTGQWAVDFLALEDVSLPHERVVSTLDGMRKFLAQRHGVRDWYYPRDQTPEDGGARTNSDCAAIHHSAVDYACAQMYHGRAQHGLDTLGAIYKSVHINARRSFNQPYMWDVSTNTPCGPCQDRHIGSLAIWHTLFALQGFFLSLPDNTMYLRPNLPESITYLNAPVFTPVGLGSLTYQVQFEEGYRQSARVAFESPTQIQHIKLAVPSEILNTEVYMRCDGDVSDARHYLERGTDRNTVHIELNHPFIIQDSVSMVIKEKAK